MNTAVQLRERTAGPGAILVWGAPYRTHEGAHGTIAVFEAGRIVAYALYPHRRRPRAFLFRTLDVDDRLAAHVAGVHPRVRLLGRFKTGRRVKLLARVLKLLAARFGDPSTLPDDFFIRIGVLVTGRAPPARALPSFIESTRNNGDFPWTF